MVSSTDSKQFTPKNVLHQSWGAQKIKELASDKIYDGRDLHTSKFVWQTVTTQLSHLTFRVCIIHCLRSFLFLS